MIEVFIWIQVIYYIFSEMWTAQCLSEKEIGRDPCAIHPEELSHVTGLSTAQQPVQP